jgi:Protein of unknown function (DUF2568)
LPPSPPADNEALPIIFEIVVFGAAALALVAVGRTGLAIALAAVALVDDCSCTSSTPSRTFARP